MAYVVYSRGYKIYLQLEKGLSVNTLDAYLHDVHLFFDFLVTQKHSPAIKDLTIKHLRDFLEYINKLGLSSYSQSRVISGIKSFFNYLLLEKIIETNPAEMLSAPKLGRKLPEILNINEVEAVMKTVDLSEPEGQRNRAILETLYGCGLRVSELTGLRISQLFVNEKIIRVTGKGNKQRLIPIGDPALQQIMIYLKEIRPDIQAKKEAEDILFLNRRGGQLSRQMVFLIVKKYIEKTGIKKNISPHTFRHSFATHLVRNGADLRAVQELLGHVSIITTEIYTHLNTNDLRNAILKYHPRSHE